MPHSDATMTFAGTVSELDVGGNGPNSAQLEFSVTPLKSAREQETFVVPFGTEPQVFAAMATLLTAAYMAKMIVTVTYLAQADAPPVAVNVKLGAPSVDASSGRIGFT
jgi:hypothetical protein